MTNVQEQVVNQVDLFWDGWLSNVKVAQEFQEDLQKKALQTFTYQKQFLDLSVKSFNAIEEQAVKLSKSWNEKAASTVQPFVNQNEVISEQLTSVSELADKVQSFSWSQGKELLNTLVGVQSYVEDTVRKVVSSQQIKNVENFEKMAALTEQLKETQKAFLKPIQA